MLDKHLLCFEIKWQVLSQRIELEIETRKSVVEDKWK